MEKFNAYEQAYKNGFDAGYKAGYGDGLIEGYEAGQRDESECETCTIDLPEAEA